MQLPISSAGGGFIKMTINFFHQDNYELINSPTLSLEQHKTEQSISFVCNSIPFVTLHKLRFIFVLPDAGSVYVQINDAAIFKVNVHALYFYA